MKKEKEVSSTGTALEAQAQGEVKNGTMKAKVRREMARETCGRKKLTADERKRRNRNKRLHRNDGVWVSVKGTPAINVIVKKSPRSKVKVDHVNGRIWLDELDKLDTVRPKRRARLMRHPSTIIPEVPTTETPKQTTAVKTEVRTTSKRKKWLQWVGGTAAGMALICCIGWRCYKKRG